MTLTMSGYYPNDAFAELRRLLASTPDPVVFDVGAHHGHTAIGFRQLLPGSTVYAFEPFLESYLALESNTANDPNICSFRLGLSDAAGNGVLHANSSSATNSLLPTDNQAGAVWGKGLLETTGQETVAVDTLDGLMQSFQLDRIDLLKLDVQGVEPRVISGGREACLGGKIRIVYTEIITQPTYQGQLRLDAFLGTFFDLGFELHNIYNLSHAPDGALRQCDAIFVNRNT